MMTATDDSHEARQILEAAIVRAAGVCPPGELPAALKDAICNELGINQLSQFFVLIKKRLEWS